MSLLAAEMRKVWSNHVFPVLLGVLVAANLLLLWIGTRPTANQPSAAAYRALGAELDGLNMAEKGEILHTALDRTDGLLRIKGYYRDLAYAGEYGMNYYLTTYREENADLFESYEQMYEEESYPLYTESLEMDYRLLKQLVNEYDTVAGYTDFLDDIQARATQLAGFSIFQSDETGYDLKNIEVTAAVYAGLGETVINYYPQKGLYTAISYAFTDLILLASMLVLALLLVRRERDSGLLGLVRSLPGGRLKTAVAKLTTFAITLLAVLVLLYGVNLTYCAATFGLGPLNRTIQSVPALMRCTMQITVGQYLFRFLLTKWVGAFVMGLWVMLAALVAHRVVAGWAAALAGPLVMFGIRAAIPATSRLNVVKYANLASLLQTNELLGHYRNLYWFGSPINLPFVEWTAAVIYGGALGIGFCWVFARAQLLPAAKRGFALGLRHKTHATSVYKEEMRKLLLLNGASIVIAAFVGFGVYQGMTIESYIDADEIYYAYYMKHISGPFTQEKYDWLTKQGEEFTPMLEAQRRVAEGTWSSEVLMAYSALQQKYAVYNRVINQNINGYLKEHPGVWPVYESGYRKLFAFTGQADVQDTLLAGLVCAICFSGLFSMERKGGMEEILQCTPLGRKHTVRAKLMVSTGAAVIIALSSTLPHLWQVLRDYGLPALLAPAMSISEFECLPALFTLSDVLLFWFLCRITACLCMGIITLWLGQRLGNLLPTLFLSAVAYCLPALLALSGMENGIEWLGVYPLFHAAALLGVQGHNTTGAPYAWGWVPMLLMAVAFLITVALAQWLYYRYEYAGTDIENGDLV